MRQFLRPHRPVTLGSIGRSEPRRLPGLRQHWQSSAGCRSTRRSRSRSTSSSRRCSSRRSSAVATARTPACRPSTSCASSTRSAGRRSAARCRSSRRRASSSVIGGGERSSILTGSAGGRISPRFESSCRRGRGEISSATPLRTSIQVNLVTVPLRSLHQVLTHAVAEGQAPDLAILDSVWIAEFAADGFLHALDDLDAGLVPERARGRLPRAARGGEPVRRAARSASRRSRTSQGSGTAGARSRRSACCRREPGRSFESVGRAAVENGLPHPIVMTGGSTGRRDDRVLPDRVPRVERRARARARGHHAGLARDGPGAPLSPQPHRRRADVHRRARLRMDEAGAAARRGKGGDQLRRQLRDANARGGARRAARRAVGSRRLHARSRRARPARRRPSPAR